MNVIQLAILTILSEEDKSFNELREILGIKKKRLAKNLRYLERKGYIINKFYLGNGDVMYGITEEGFEELYKNYVFLKELIQEMEISVCARFNC